MKKFSWFYIAVYLLVWLLQFVVECIAMGISAELLAVLAFNGAFALVLAMLVAGKWRFGPLIGVPLALIFYAGNFADFWLMTTMAPAVFWVAAALLLPMCLLLVYYSWLNRAG